MHPSSGNKGQEQQRITTELHRHSNHEPIHFSRRPFRCRHGARVHIRAVACNERWQIDLVDLREFTSLNNGFSWLMVIVDVFSKYCFTRPLTNKSASIVSTNLVELFYIFGPPKIIQSDNGKEFTNSTLSDVCSEWKILQKFSRPRHPQSQGQVERLNQTICRLLQKNLLHNEQKKWIEIISKITFNYNATVHSATKKSPFQLYYNRLGYNTVLYNSQPDVETETESVESESSNTVDNELYYARMRRNSLVHVSKYSFKVGDFVIIKKDFDNNTNTRKGKFESFYSKKCVILELNSNNRALVEFEDGSTKIVSLILLKKVE